MKLPSTIFLPSNNANFQEMYHVARFLIENELGKPYFLPEKYANLTTLQDFNLDDLIFLNKPKPIAAFLGKIFNRLESFIGKRRSDQENKKRLSVLLKKRFVECEKILDSILPTSVVLRGDRHLGNGWEPAMIKACRQRNIPRIIINYAYPSFKSGFIYNRRNKPDCNADLSPGLRNHYPSQVVFDRDRGKYYLYRAAYKIEALAENNMLPENPWVMGGSGSTSILLDSEHKKSQYIKSGVADKKIIVTGVGAHDKLYKKFKKKEQLRRELFLKYHFKKEKKIIIAAPAQLYEERLLDKDEAMSEFEYLCSQLSRLKENCLLSLHPRMEKENYSSIAKSYDILIAEEPLSEILPCADLFTANYSSTVQWAVLCHIPTVIFNFYDCIEPIYQEIKGVVSVGKENYLSTMRTILNNRERYNQLKQANVKQAVNYSPFDGNCTKRIAQILIQNETD